MPVSKSFRTSLATAATLALGACAQTGAPHADEYDAMLANLDAQRDCFQQREINGYANAPGGSGGSERIVVRAGVREEWLLETTGACPELDFSRAVAFDTRGATSICTGDLETLLVPSSISGGADRCPVRVLGRLIEN